MASVQQQQSTSPRRPRSRSACWYAKRARAAAEGGRHRDRDAQRHVHAGWLTGKTREGLHVGRAQARRAPLLAAVGWAPGLPILYLQSLLYLNLNPGRRRRLLQPCGLSRRPGLVGETLRQARKRRVVSGRQQVVSGDSRMQAGKPCSCCLALPCCHRPASLLSLLSLPLPLPHLTGAASCLAHCFGVFAGQGKARQDKASAAPARIIGRKQRDAEFHVAGCRRTVGCGLERRREALAVAAMIGRA